MTFFFKWLWTRNGFWFLNALVSNLNKETAELLEFSCIWQQKKMSEKADENALSMSTTAHLKITNDHVHFFILTDTTYHKAHVKADILNVTVCSLYLNGLHRSQYSTTRLRCGGNKAAHVRFTWNFYQLVMLSCQYAPKSVRDVSSTLLNLRRQKGVQPKTGSVTNKVTVNTYFYISSALERSKPVTGNYQDVEHSHESHSKCQ